MNRRLLASVVACFAAAGCGPVPARHVVDIRDMAFGPPIIEAAVGDTIAFVNHDLFPHTSTADGAAGWNTGLIPADSSRTAVARRPGTYTYICQVHPTMTGRVVVK